MQEKYTLIYSVQKYSLLCSEEAWEKGPIAHKYCLRKMRLKFYKYLGGVGKRDLSIVLRKTCLNMLQIFTIYNKDCG